VSDPKGLAGIVTDRDLALAVLGHGSTPPARHCRSSCRRMWSPATSARISPMS
jgi:hypothetical protein